MEWRNHYQQKRVKTRFKKHFEKKLPFFPPVKTGGY